MSDRFTWITTIGLGNREWGEDSGAIYGGYATAACVPCRVVSTASSERPAGGWRSDRFSVGRPLVPGMDDHGDPTCEMSEGPVSVSVSSAVLLTLRTLLKDLLSIELPSLKVRESNIAAGEYSGMPCSGWS